MAQVQAAPKTAPREPVRSAVGKASTPIQDDAALLDVQFVDTHTGWAVGEHGVIWKTENGGRAWQFQPTAVDCALRSASFLTDQVGWVAGGGSLAYSKVSVGMLLFTDDGGATWQQRARDALPELHRIKFFSPEFGIAVGEPDGEHPSGLFLTTDGGQTWRTAPGAADDAWRTADFLHPEHGVLVGRRGRVARLGNGKLLPPQFGNVGLRAGAAVKLIDEREGWMVGDGGLLLCTHDGGLVWEAPPTLLPEAAADVFDFRTIAFRKSQGWIAGSPGSTIWHTPDSGRTWRRQSTGQPLPIAALAFPSDTEGWAVGAMGMMLHTSDGGETWQAIRGGGRRAAFLASYARPEQASVHLVTKLSGESAYRGVVSLLARRDVGPDGHASADLSLRLNEAVVNCGGTAGLIDWRFPISTTGLDDNSEKLVADWNRRSEGRLGPVLLGRLVEQLRIWRPSVLILNRPTEGDAVTRLLYDATLRAVEQAADPTRFVPQQELGGLAPWIVTRVFTRLPDGSSGHAMIDPYEYLPHLGTSVATAASLASGRLSLRTTATPVTETYSLVDIALRPGAAPDKRGDFFAGLNIGFDSDARRALVVLTEDDVEKQMKLAQQQRNFHAYVDRYLDDSRHANQLIGQINDIVRNMPPEQAALQLAELGDAYRRTGQWELAESAFVEVVERYPHEAPARDAMRWLLQMWIGAETTWRRVNLAGTTTKAMLSVDAQSVVQRIENANYRAEHPELKGREVDPIPTEAIDPDVQIVGNSRSPLRKTSVTGEVQIDTDRNARLRAMGHWQDRARQMGLLMERTSPALYRAPEIQFPLAALYRQATRHDRGEEIYHSRIHSGRDGPWEKSAQAELWLAHPAELPPKPLYICRRAERPQLDGVLADPCWQKADELPLVRDEQADKPPVAHAFVMLCYDNDYLYLAGAFPRVGELPSDPPQTKGRTHDADLSKHDRLTLLLDVDRDYATFYRFNIDQRGLTSEDCWGDRTWNPRWYVAVDSDRDGWRIEVAIPMKELLPVPPRRDTVWNASVIRTIPAVGVESWTHPATSVPRLEVSGMIRFE